MNHEEEMRQLIVEMLEALERAKGVLYREPPVSISLEQYEQLMARIEIAIRHAKEEQ